MGLKNAPSINWGLKTGRIHPVRYNRWLIRDKPSSFYQAVDGILLGNSYYLILSPPNNSDNLINIYYLPNAVCHNVAFCNFKQLLYVKLKTPKLTRVSLLKWRKCVEIESTSDITTTQRLWRPWCPPGSYSLP